MFDYDDSMFTDALEEMATLPDTAVDERFRLLELQSRSVQAELSAAVHVAEGRGTYREDGHRTMPAYLRATWNASDGEVSRQRKLAVVCGAIPTVGDAPACGRIGVSQVLAGLLHPPRRLDRAPGRRPPTPPLRRRNRSVARRRIDGLIAHYGRAG